MAEPTESTNPTPHVNTIDPNAPAGREANWVATVPDKGWFAILRLYGALEPWFDKTWKPGDFEQVK